MGISTQRVIGPSIEREIEHKRGLEDLHISWQKVRSEQVQRDPSGQPHLAPLVTWKIGGKRYEYMPTLQFQVNLTEEPWLRRLLGISDQAGHIIDRDQLIRDIEKAVEVTA